MEQTGSFSFWLSAGVGGLIVVLYNYLTNTPDAQPPKKKGLGWLPGTAYFICLIATTALASILCWIFKLPINPDAVTHHATLSMTAFGMVLTTQQHQEAKATRSGGDPTKSPTGP
ncbi:MAG: hypothetical protein HY851_08775 [candidate division Zixibacteria bacterium]|nr:hypothetical protein [candidate division Zixibacteria bacterium]